MRTRRAKPVPPSNQTEALAPFLADIARMRGDGVSVRAIAERLVARGVEVDHNAVHRFCQKHGIAQAPSKPTSYESFPPETQAHPNGTAAPHERAATPLQREIGPSVIPPQVSAPGFPTIVERTTILGPVGPPTTSIVTPTHTPLARHGAHAPFATSHDRPDRPSSPHPVDRRAASPVSTVPEAAPAPAALPIDPADLALAKFLREWQPFVERIIAAEQVSEAAGHAAVREAMAWLEALPSTVPEHIRQLAHKVTQDTKGLLAMAEMGKLKRPEPVPPAPLPLLFEPLPRAPVWTPDLELLALKGGADRWTLQDACEGTLILGATGSGKTSGSGRLLAHSFLNAHFGGLILTAKQDEAALWTRYAQQTRRTEQLCLVRPGSPFRFNFLDYQSRLPEAEGGSTENIVELLHTILEAFSKSAHRGTSDGGFWANTSKQLLRNLVRILRATKAPLKLDVLRSFLSEAPKSTESAQSNGWRSTPTFGKLIAEAELINQARPGDVALQEALRFWTVDFPALHGRTRSIILADFTALTDLLHDPVLNELLGSETTITPEAVFDGALIVIDLPIEKWLSIGRMAQLVWKHFLQLTVRRRGDADDASRRPVFLWADEFQNFLSGETDAAFQATARSARCATVYLTQTIPGLYIQAGAFLPAERTDALLANLCTKFIHASSDPRTNEWAATQIGKSTQYRASVSSGDEAPASGWGQVLSFLNGSRSKTTTSPVIDYEVQPSEFAALATGGKRYRGIVEVFILKSGACFSTGKHWLRTAILQEGFGP